MTLLRRLDPVQMFLEWSAELSGSWPCDGNSIIIKPETVSLPDPLFAHPVVGELDVALVVEQHVVQLEVAVDDAALVQIVQRQADLRAVEPRMLLGKPK